MPKSYAFGCLELCFRTRKDMLSEAKKAMLLTLSKKAMLSAYTELCSRACELQCFEVLTELCSGLLTELCFGTNKAMIKRKKETREKQMKKLLRDDNKTYMFFHVLHVFLCF